MHNGDAHAAVEFERVVAASRFRYRCGICICAFSGLSSVLLVCFSKNKKVLLVVLSECRSSFQILFSFR
jgi:hypothetical protein